MGAKERISPCTPIQESRRDIWKGENSVINNRDFVAAVKRNGDRVTAYKLGESGDGGLCDCIGLIIGAIRLCGGKWTGVHGTNYAARNEMRSLLRTADASELALGDLVYKAREPGQSGYALPSRYAGSSDQKDYYHVGVVTGLEPLEITHCTSVPGGIRRDSRLGQWRFAGRLKGVALPEAGDEEKEVIPMNANYRVTGGSLNMRYKPSKSEAKMAAIPDGQAVYAVACETPGWMKVTYSGKTGYCMAEYLVSLDNTGGMDEDTHVLAILDEIAALVERARGML